MGPVGSSKTSACCMELFDRAQRQKPDGKVRRTRWAALRNTYPELKSSTIRTWLEWFPMTQMRWDVPISGRLNLTLPDATQVDCEILFLALERPEEADKLSSVEFTGLWLNEAREMAKTVLDKATERAGRFPPVAKGGPTWRGVLMDTNPPDDDHWYYRMAEKSDPEMASQVAKIERTLREMGYLVDGQPLYEFFKQPGGLIFEGGEYKQNPLAENIAALDGGYAYYFRQLANKDPQWIRSQLLGQYASFFDGQRVYEGYNDELHHRDVDPVPTVPLLIGLDYGLSPAAAICQLTPEGRFSVLSEVVSEDGTDAESFAENLLKPHLAMKYRTMAYQAVGDPAGLARSESNAKTVFMTLAEHGIPAVPATTNDPTARWDAVKHFLNRLVNGRPAFALGEADTMRKGFNGGYHFKRVQTSSGALKNLPEKNRYSHVHDALQYACLYARTQAVSSTFATKIEYPKRTGIV